MPALFHIDLGLLDEYDIFLSDILKWFSILLTMHIFKVLGGSAPFFSGEFLQNILIAIVGLSLYHLVISKTVKFIYNDKSEEGFTGTIRIFNTNKKKFRKKRKSKK